MGLAVNDVVALTYQGTFAGQQIRYTLHWRVSTAGSSTTPELDLLAMATNFSLTGNTLTGLLQACHVDSFNFDAVSAQRVYPTRTIRMNVLSSFPGVVAETGLPPNVAVVITKRTLTPGRQGLGSLHLAGVSQTWVTDGEVTTITDYNALAAQMASSATIPAVSMTVEPGLFNPILAPGHFSRMFDAFLQLTTRTMRRRTVRIGI